MLKKKYIKKKKKKKKELLKFLTISFTYLTSVSDLGVIQKGNIRC